MVDDPKPDDGNDGEPGTLGELIESIADVVSERTSKSIFKGLADLLDQGAQSSDGDPPKDPPTPKDDPPKDPPTPKAEPIRARKISWL